MIESVRQRQKCATDFAAYYENLCALQDTCPLGSVTANLQDNIVDCNADRIRTTDWNPLLNALKVNKSLRFVAFRSCWQQTLYPDGRNDVSEQRLMALKKKSPPIRSKDMTHKLSRTLKEMLYVSDKLECIVLQGIPLRERDLSALSKGIMKNKSLKHFSLEFCQIRDSGLDVVCNAIKNSESLTSVNFSACNLSWRGAVTLAKVIKHQATNRHSVAWQNSLRYRSPDLDRMPGLRRITICKNPLISDQGAEIIAEALKDDLWVKALDMQQCGISTEGARTFQQLLRFNTSLVVLDLRLNPLINRQVLTSLLEQVLLNNDGNSETEYPWLVVEEPKPGRINQTSRRNGGSTRTVSTGYNKRTAPTSSRIKPSSACSGKHRKSHVTRPSEKHLPWRTAERAGRQRYNKGTVPGEASPYSTSQRSHFDVKHGLYPEEEEESTTTTSTLVKETRIPSVEDYGAEVLDPREIKNMRVELELMKRRLQDESEERIRSNTKIMELEIENRRLHQEIRLMRSRNQQVQEALSHKELPDTRGQHSSAQPSSVQSEAAPKPKQGSISTVLEDEKVLESIETTFKQFHSFLDMLKNAGHDDLHTLLSQAMNGAQGAEAPLATSSTNNIIQQQETEVQS